MARRANNSFRSAARRSTRASGKKPTLPAHVAQAHEVQPAKPVEEMTREERKRWFGCERKIRHSTRGEAKLYLRKTKHYHRAYGRKSVYACRYCGGYHIGGAIRREHKQSPGTQSTEPESAD